MSNWRPEGLKNPFNRGAVVVMDRENKPVSHYDAWEAGADAMLEALKGDRYIDCSKMDAFGYVLNDLPPKFRMRKNWKGWIVFIPGQKPPDSCNSEER
jgi:hypothetical protein